LWISKVDSVESSATGLPPPASLQHGGAVQAGTIIVPGRTSTCQKGNNNVFYFHFLVKQVLGRGPEQRESGKTVLYPLIIIIILISYIISKSLIRRRTIPAETGNGTPTKLFF